MMGRFATGLKRGLKPHLKRWFRLPDSIAGRTMAVMVAGLTLSHLASLGAYRFDLLAQADDTLEREAAERIAAMSTAVAAAPPGERERTAHLVSGHTLDAHWSRIPQVEDAGLANPPLTALRDRLLELVPGQRDRPLRLAMAEGEMGRTVLVSAQLPDGDWLNLRCPLPGPAPHTSHGLLASTAVMVAAVLAVSLVLVRSATAPLRTMAEAAERLGVDVTAPPMPETGPAEVRRAARAFNDMQERLKRLLADRTHMLAAISHDLRTPLTVMRLRAEFIEDEEQHARMLADIGEMEAMIASTLAFLREDAQQRETAVADVAVTLATVCDAMADAGHAVSFSGPGHVPLRCRPIALKRAFVNLVDNAVKYGGGARVELSVTDGRDLRIVVMDDGPGIPAGDLDTVFQPFRRLETSRSRETGGFGLGLTVARSTIRAHGGDIRLANRPSPEPGSGDGGGGGGGGLCATITLPWVRA